MLFVMSMAAVLAQTEVMDAGVISTTPAIELSEGDKALLAAQRAAEASERAALAVERLANELAGPPMPVAAPSAAGWNGSFGFGLAWISGNTQTLTITSNFALDRKWVDWAFGVRASGAYGLANPSAAIGGTAQTTARRANGTMRLDRSFGKGFAAAYVLGGAELDHVKSIDFRGIGEAGAALTFVNRVVDEVERLYVRLDLALRAGGESRYQYFPIGSRVNDPLIAILAPRIAGTLRWGFNKHVRLSEEVEVIPFLLAPTLGRVLINNTTKLSARLTEGLALTTTFQLNYDSMPPEVTGGPARLPLDTVLTLGLDAIF